MLAVVVATSLIRGDRVVRLGLIGAAVTAVPWAVCQGLAALTDDRGTAMALLHLGQGPVALVGPNLLLVLLAVSGQLERYRWIARISAVVAAGLLAAAWTTSWTTPGVQRLSSGMYYVSPGPLTGIHLSQVVLWLAVGLVILRRSSPRNERRRVMRLLFGIVILAAIASLDTLLLYGVWGSYPVAWVPALIAASVALYQVLRTDLLRPQGFDRGVAVEPGWVRDHHRDHRRPGPGTARRITGGDRGVGKCGVGDRGWLTAWAWERSRPVRVADERALEQFVCTGRHARPMPRRSPSGWAALWKRAIGVEVRTTCSEDARSGGPPGGPPSDGGRGGVCDRRKEGELDPGGARPYVVSRSIIPTVRSRSAIWRRCARRCVCCDELGAYSGHGLVVPLDRSRGSWSGSLEADYDTALRDADRGLITSSARATARAFTFVGPRPCRVAGTRAFCARGRGRRCPGRLQYPASRDCRFRAMGGRRRVSNRAAHDRCRMVHDREPRRWSALAVRDRGAGATALPPHSRLRR